MSDELGIRRLTTILFISSLTENNAIAFFCVLFSIFQLLERNLLDEIQ